MPTNNYKWTQCDVVISNCEGEGMPPYWASLHYDRERELVTIMVNQQDIGMHIRLDQLKEQLATWFTNIEARVE